MSNKTDNVNHPSHYTAYPVEVIDMIKNVLTRAYGPDAFKAYCLGNEIKYRMRAGIKPGDDDIAKAEKYREFRNIHDVGEADCVETINRIIHDGHGNYCGRYCECGAEREFVRPGHAECVDGCDDLREDIEKSFKHGEIPDWMRNTRFAKNNVPDHTCTKEEDDAFKLLERQRSVKDDLK